MTKSVRPSKATASISKVDGAARAVGFDGIGCTRDIGVVEASGVETALG
jgi:hypothetical protein